VVYDLSNTNRGVRDCPRCRHTMETLRARLHSPRNEGYLLDEGGEGGSAIAFWLFGWIGLVLRLFYRYTLQPLTSKLAGEMKEKRLARVLRDHPNTLICPYCNHLLKRK
jgi:hypothetical protein